MLVILRAPESIDENGYMSISPNEILTDRTRRPNCHLIGAMEAIVVMDAGYLIHQGMEFYDAPNQVVRTTCDVGWVPKEDILRVFNRNDEKIYPCGNGKVRNRGLED